MGRQVHKGQLNMLGAHETTINTWLKANAHSRPANVRYWHLADIPSRTAHVRFTSKADMPIAPQNVRQ
jgi:hypothetical protein